MCIQRSYYYRKKNRIPLHTRNSPAYTFNKMSYLVFNLFSWYVLAFFCLVFVLNVLISLLLYSRVPNKRGGGENNRGGGGWKWFEIAIIGGLE